MDWTVYGYLGLFVGTFVAATVVPMSSEALFGAFLYQQFDLNACIMVATAGNFLGGLTGYYLGWLGRWDWIERFFGISKQSSEKWQAYCQQYGAYLALGCWLPVVGDVICVALGFVKAPFWRVSVAMLLGKLLRYIALGYILTATFHQIK